MSVIVLHGRNTVDIDERITALLLQYDPQQLNSSTLHTETADASDIRAAVSTPGFFGTTRVVVVKGIPAVDRTARLEWSDLEDVLIAAPESTTVILVTNQKIPANRRVLKTAKSRQWSVELYDLLYGDQLVAWVGQRAELHGCAIDANASRELLGRLFPTVWQREDRWNPQSINMRLLATEVEKLAAGTVDGRIATDTVRALVADRSGVTAFKLNDETYEGRSAAALVELDKMLANGEAPERIIGQLGYQPLVLFASRLVQRYGPDTVAEAAGISAGQLKATVSRKSAWRNRPGTSGAAQALRRSEWLVKTGRSPAADAVIVPLVAEVAEGFER